MSSNFESSLKTVFVGVVVVLMADLWTSTASGQPLPPVADGCTQTASMEFGLNSSSSVAVKGIPIGVTATTPTVVIENDGPPNCAGLQRRPASNWTWQIDVPPGSLAQLSNVDPLNVVFTPDVSGSYVVHLLGCGNQCTMKLVTDFVNGKRVIEDVDISSPERQMAFVVTETAQVPPRLTPPPGLYTFGGGNDCGPCPADKTATSPQSVKWIKDGFCGSPFQIGIGNQTEWFTTAISDTPTPPLQLLEGRVYDSFVSRIDTPFGHSENDADVKVEVDPWLRSLLVDGSAAADYNSFALPLGGMEVEWEWSRWFEGARPLTGDRISVLGNHVVDCGHTVNTEIHPPIAVAVHRPLPVLLPPVTPLENGGPPVAIGTNIYVPGVVTDVFVNLRGGVVLDCAVNSLKQPKLVTTQIGGQTVHLPPCVPQPDLPGRSFEFHVYLPVNPQRIVKSLVGGNPKIPALFTQIVDSPEVVPGSRTDIPISITDMTHLDSDAPYITVSVDISKMRTGQTFSKRLIAAWVYPDITGNNYGLQAFRLRLDRLQVTNSADEIGSGDWHFWIGYSNAARPWTRLINCDGCVDPKTYTPSSGLWAPGALGADGLLKGEMLEFQQFVPYSMGRLRMTGYDSDTFSSDDTGEVNTLIGTAGSFDLQSDCTPQADQPAANSGCGAYVAHLVVEPGTTPTSATISNATKAFLNTLLIGKHQMTMVSPITDTELFSGQVTARVANLTSHTKVEGEAWQAAFARQTMPDAIQKSGDPDKFVRSMRTRIIYALGPNPSVRQRAKVRADLTRIKKSVPPALYQKYLCDLEFGKPCAPGQ